MNKFSRKVLVLNADFMPILRVDLEKAMGMLYVKKTATELDFYPEKIKDSMGRQYPIPAVLLLKKMIKRSYRKVPFNKKNVFLRDKCTCQYCKKVFAPTDLTYDHVIPRSKWNSKHEARFPQQGCTQWENIVTACRACNLKKGDKTPEQAGMPLSKKPKQPTYAEIALGLSPFERVPKEWIPYLQNLSKTNLVLET